MIDMRDDYNIKHSLSAIYPIVKNIETFEEDDDTIKVSVHLPIWTWMCFGTIHKQTQKQMEATFSVHGLQNKSYIVEVH